MIGAAGVYYFRSHLEHVADGYFQRRVLWGSGLQRKSSKRAVRIIVQRTKEQKRWSYRLIAYEDNRTYSAVNFVEISDLMQAIRLAVPDFSESSLTINVDADCSYIAFSGDWELNDGELFLLGLNPQE